MAESPASTVRLGERPPASGVQAPVTVAVSNYNGKAYLADTLAAAWASVPPGSEVMVVDNASTDGSVALVERRFSQTRILVRGGNDGPGSARNLALRKARFPQVFLIDNDVAPQPGCLEALREAMRRFPAAAVAMPAILYRRLPRRVQFAGGEAHFLGSVAPLEAGQRVEDLDPSPRRCSSIISAALLVDRDRLGGRALFNEELFIYQEDHEAGLRLGIQGGQIVCAPSARCLHGAGSIDLSIRQTGRVTPMRQRQTIYNRWYVVATLYQFRTLARFAPAFLCYEIVQLLGSVASGGGSHWLWAFGRLFRQAGPILRQRRRVGSRRVHSDRELLKGGAFPFNRETAPSRLQKAGQAVVNAVCQANWRLAGPRSACPPAKSR